MDRTTPQKSVEGFNPVRLKHLSDADVENRFRKFVQTERSVTHLVLECISEIEVRRIFLHRGFPSVFEYLVRGHGYSPSAAVRRIDSARLLREIPEVSEKVQKGTINLSQLAQVQQAVRANEKMLAFKMAPEEKMALVEKVESCSQRDTEMILARELSLPIPAIERLQYHRDESVTLTMTLSKQQIEVWERARDAVSHSVPERKWSIVLTYLAEREVKRRWGPQFLS